MIVRYTSIYKVHGANTLLTDTACAHLFELESPAMTATLTTTPASHFLHIDRSDSLAAQLLKGLFSPDQAGTWQERLAAEVEEVSARRVERAGAGVFLVFEGETNIPSPAFELRRDTDEFVISFDAIAKSEIRETFRSLLQAIITALSLTFPETADRRFEKLGDVVFLIDPSNGKPVYDFSMEVRPATLSLAIPVTEQIITEASVLASQLLGQQSMTRPVSLLFASLQQSTNDLQRFYFCLVCPRNVCEFHLQRDLPGTLVRHNARWRSEFCQTCLRTP